MAKYRTTETVALLLAVMLRRSEKTRGRISEKTLKVIAQRKKLRGAFETQLGEWLDYYDTWFVALDRGGWALVAKSALEGAPPITAANLIKNELIALHDGSFDPSAIISELGYNTDATEE